MKKVKIEQELPLNFTMEGEGFANTLYNNTVTHITNVSNVMDNVTDMMLESAANHDFSKLKEDGSGCTPEFIRFARSKFEGDWFETIHVQNEKHHYHDFAHEDVTLMDIIEGLVDGVCAGRGRGNQEPYDKEISNDILQAAVRNTFELIKNMTK